MRHLAIDLETFSEADLTKCGVYRYAEDPSFEVLFFGVSVDGGPVTVYDLKQGDSLPEEIISSLLDSGVTKWAFNAAFERVCLSRLLWDLNRLERGTYIDPRGWRCSMVWAGYMGFPMSLKGAGAALGLEEQKMEEGKSLITYFCKPYRQTSKNNYTNRNLPHHDPEKWSLFKQYNARDVEVELSIAEKLKNHPVPEQVWEEYWLDQEINDRGILIDLPMVENAIVIDEMARANIKREMQQLSGLSNPQSLPQMQRWLKENGVELDSLGKKELANELDEIAEPMRSVLLLRQQLAMSAVKKYQAMETAVCSDNRCRGMFRFYGANRSGRFCLSEGTPVLVKTLDGTVTEKPIENVLITDLVFDGKNWVRHEGVVYSGEKDVITWDGITATPEHMVFISEDEKIPLIEAKNRKVGLWRGSTDPVNLIAEREKIAEREPKMRTYDIVNAGPHNRFMANGRIVSNSGKIIQLQNLFRNSLPDLEEARALVRAGDYDALEMLYDSVPEVLAQCVRTAFIPAPGMKMIVADFSAIECRVLAWLAGEQWVLDAFAVGKDIYCETASHMFHLPVEKHGVNGELRQRGKQATLSCIAEGQLVLTDRGEVPIEEVRSDDKVWDGEEWVNHDGVVFRGEREVITYEGLTATPDHLVCSPLGFVPFSAIAGEQAVCAGKRKVYDIRNAGPRHCFTVSGWIVHNCGYGGSSGALIAMGALDAGMKEEELQPLVNAWREANPNIVRLWWSVDRAVKTAVKERTTTHTHGLEFRYQGGMLYITLPSSRQLCYVRPRMGQNRFGGESVTYMGTDLTKHWSRIETFGGKLVENCIGEGTLVITNQGLVPIEKITNEMKIWDGEDYVTHQGIISQGNREVLTVNGIHMTPEHKILTERGWKRCAESRGLYWAPVKLPSAGYFEPCPVKIEKGLVEAVYDIRNCGPRHRFVVWNGKQAFIVSNCVQAISRDILCFALENLRKYRIVAHVHDEVIIEAPPETTVEEICSIMGQVPPWASGLILRADGYECKEGYYKKD